MATCTTQSLFPMLSRRWRGCTKLALMDAHHSHACGVHGDANSCPSTSRCVVPACGLPSPPLLCDDVPPLTLGIGSPHNLCAGVAMYPPTNERRSNHTGHAQSIGGCDKFMVSVHATLAREMESKKAPLLSAIARTQMSPQRHKTRARALLVFAHSPFASACCLHPTPTQ